MPMRGRPVPASATKVTWYGFDADVVGSKATTVRFCPATVLDISFRKSAYEWISVLFTEVMTVYACIPAVCAGEAPCVKATMPTPSWTGVTAASMTEENTTAKRTARSMFVAGPAAERRARSGPGKAQG